MLIKPFTARIDSTGKATLEIRHDIHGLVWKVFQIGFGLGVVANSAQVAANVNGVPLTTTVTMQVSVFAYMTGKAPYSMETFFYGPPYILLSAGDFIECGVISASPGDTFTAAAYVEEHQAYELLTMGQ